MDEPLGALDKQLREHMQIEIKQLHERLGLTVVYVTHDQSEALTMSDRIAVFHDGARGAARTRRTRSTRQPQDRVRRRLHRREQPAGRHRGRGGRRRRGGDAWTAGCEVGRTAVGAVRPAHPCVIAVRPEAIRLADDATPVDNACRAAVTSRIYLGDHQRLLTAIEERPDRDREGRGRADDRIGGRPCGWHG